jgi:uncharacterized protein (DUF2345 family)
MCLFIEIISESNGTFISKAAVFSVIGGATKSPDV